MAPLRRGDSQPFPIVEERPLQVQSGLRTQLPAHAREHRGGPTLVLVAVLGVFSQLSRGILTLALFPFVDILDAETEA